MSAIIELVEIHPECESNECFRFGCGGGRIGVEACADRLTPYGGFAAWSHYGGRIGIVENLAQRSPVERTSPNAKPVRDILHGFMINALMGGSRIAHIRRMTDAGRPGGGCDSRAQAWQGVRRRCIHADDESGGSGQGAVVDGGQRTGSLRCAPAAFIADWDSTVNTRYGHHPSQ